MNRRPAAFFRPLAGPPSALPCPRRARRAAFALAWLAASATVTAAPLPPAPRYAAPQPAGELAEPANRETSGLAASRRTPNLLWTHNDSGGEPVLFAVRTTGFLVGRLRVAGAENRDWEDIASFTLDDRPWLLIADTGDNHARHGRSVLHVIPEPGLDALMGARELTVAPAYSIWFRYEDGPRDCEAVAVDAAARAVYLLSKRDLPPRLYRLPLAAADHPHPAVAQRVGLVPHLPRPHLSDTLSFEVARALRGEPTAMDFLPDGSAALVLTYGGAFLFPRAPGASWADALAAEPVALPPFSLPQAEAACFADAARAIYVASEKVPQLLRYDRAP